MRRRTRCRCCGRHRPLKTMWQPYDHMWVCKDGDDCLKAEERLRRRQRINDPNKKPFIFV